jgi:hypothetical protein
MNAAASSQNPPSLRQLTVLALERSEAFVAAVALVDVEHQQVVRPDAEVGFTRVELAALVFVAALGPLNPGAASFKGGPVPCIAPANGRRTSLASDGADCVTFCATAGPLSARFVRLMRSAFANKSPCFTGLCGAG